MKVSPLEKACSEILCNSLQPLEAEKLLELVDNAAFAAGLSNPTPVAAGPDGAFRFDCGAYRVEITQLPEPAKPIRYLSAALSQITQDTFPDAAKKITDHQAVCFVSVYRILSNQGDNKAEPANEGTQSFSPLQTSQQVLMAMNLLRAVTLPLVMQLDASAVYWASNGYLLNPDTFKTFASADSLTFLCLHPSYHSLGLVQNGPAQIGMLALGAQHLIGHEVSFEAGPYPPDYMASITNAFVRQCERQGSVLENGATFGPSPDEVFLVSYHAQREDEPFSIVLSPLRSQTLAVSDEADEETDAETDLYPEETGELDFEDQVDAAILQKLKTASAPAKTTAVSGSWMQVSLEREPVMMVAGAASSAETVDATVEASPSALIEYVPASKPALPPRASVHELREIARKMQKPMVEQTRPAPSNSIVGRLRKLFG